MPNFSWHHGPAKNIIPEIKSSLIRNEIPAKKRLHILEETICCDSEEKSSVDQYSSNVNNYHNKEQQVDLGGKLELSLADSMLTCVETIQENKKSEMFANQVKLEAKMNDYDTKFKTLVCRINELVCNGIKCQLDDTSEVLNCTGKLAVDSKNVSANIPIRGTSDYDQTKCNFEECVCKLIGVNNDIAGNSQNDFSKLSKHTEKCCSSYTDEIMKEKKPIPQQYDEKIKSYSTCLETLNNLLYGTVKINDQNCETEYNRTTKCSQNLNVQSTINMTKSVLKKNKPPVGCSVTRCGEVFESRKEDNSTSNFSILYNSVYRDIGNILQNPHMTPEQKIYETSKILRSKKYF